MRRGEACLSFKADGYVVVRAILPPSEAKRLAINLAASIDSAGAESDRQVPGSPARYA
jgi:hypothetical protein